jgi:serine/threonine-protein kinase RsbW
MATRSACDGVYDLRAMTTPDRRLRVPAELERLAEVRQLVREATRAAGAQPGTVDDLVQAVDEAAANTITHGYAGAPGWIEVGVAVAGEDLLVTIEDDAPAFDPTRNPEPDMSVSALVRGPHGMGIHLMRLATDGMTYRPREGGGNILTLTRSLTAQPEENR